jgi:hypothetical protein
VIEVFDCEQGTPDWFACRMGIPTASEFATVLMHGKKKGEPSATRRKYMLTLIGERLTGKPVESYSNANMLRGKEHEPEARRLYQFIRDEDTKQVGFIRNGNKGCSPDLLVNANGMTEFKSNQPHILLEMHLADEVPKEHECQLQGGLWVAEREWIDFMAYWPGIEPFIKRVYRDEVKIKSIELGVEMFNNELHELLTKLEQKAA